MWLIGLTISLFSIIKTRALECVSVINRKCMPRPKILDVNEGVGEALFYSYNVLLLLVIICFCVFAYFRWFKSKYTNNATYTYEQR